MDAPSLLSPCSETDRQTEGVRWANTKSLLSESASGTLGAPLAFPNGFSYYEMENEKSKIIIWAPSVFNALTNWDGTDVFIQ